ncbi:uncharacterized protein LOC105640334 [Jatropha curcas]|uniref:uncharacterized protein LOC105640334 n=1 Tax=Jatropha curcas TaxID=180498 RepID=UPI0005FADAB2|nr:uncharacterized protein LOC105640334 [Jatropha curcas]
MADFGNQTCSIEELYVWLSMEEKQSRLELAEDGDKGAEDTNDSPYCVVGRLLIEKPVNFIALKNTIASVWRPIKRMITKDLGNNAFVFQFIHPMDLERVVKCGLWNFSQNLLLLKHLPIDVDTKQVEITKIDFWFQIHNMLIGYKSKRLGKEVGNCIGTFIEADSKNFTGIWREYMRIRVSLNIHKPLKRRMQIKKARGDWIWIIFKYERLSTFCFFYGMLGHSDRFARF